MVYSKLALESLLGAKYAVSGLTANEPLPSGDVAVGQVSGSPVSPLQSSSTNVLSIRTRKLHAEIDPVAETISLTAQPGEQPLTLNLSGLDGWSIVSHKNQILEVTLSGTFGSGSLYAYTIGTIRWDADLPISFATGPSADVVLDSAWPYHGKVTGNWHVASEQPVTIKTDGTIEETTGARYVGVFYHARDAARMWGKLYTLEPIDQIIPITNVSKLMKVAHLGFWLDIERDLYVEFPKQMVLVTSTKGSLDMHGKAVNVSRAKGTSDPEHLIDIISEIGQRRSGNSFNDIVNVVSSAIRGEPTDVTITENEDPDDGGYAGACYDVRINLSTLEALGFTPPFTAILDRIETVAKRATALGVKVTLIEEGGGVYDTAVYDGAGAANAYGS